MTEPLGAVPLAARAGRLPVSGGPRPTRLRVTWWEPVAPPTAAVFLLHGFARSGRRLGALAAHLAEAGFLVMTPSLRSADPWRRTVEHLGGNEPFLAAIAAALCDREALAAAARSAGVTSVPDQWGFAGHSAGGDAVAYLAAQAARLRLAPCGVVLLDPVPSFTGRNLATGVSGLIEAWVPVRMVCAPPSSCNSRGAGQRLVLSLVDGFAGIELVDGSHVDAEGDTGGRLAQRVCGQALPANVSAVRTVTAAWLRGWTDPAAPPGDVAARDLVATGRAVALQGRAG